MKRKKKIFIVTDLSFISPSNDDKLHLFMHSKKFFLLLAIDEYNIVV